MNPLTLSLADKLLESRARRKIGDWIMTSRRNASCALNIGCGLHPIPGVTNVDKYSELADVQIDVSELTKRFAAGAQHIETHHVIEHLDFVKAARFASDCHRILEYGGGGALIVTCPDLTKVARLLLRSEMLNYTPERQAYVYRMLYGSQEHAGMYHHSGYTRRSLAALLQQTGFSSVFTYSCYPVRPTPSLLGIGYV